MKPVALTIAGSDPSGGAGIQADLKTFHQFGVYGASVLTLLTVQNTQRVDSVDPLDADYVSRQLHAVVEDIPPDAAKTGALGSAAIVGVIAEWASASNAPLVVDPVLVSTHGAALAADDVRRALLQQLLPQATLATPNRHEAETLAEMEIDGLEAMREAARKIAALGPRAVLVKGGHVESGDEAIDVLYSAGSFELFRSPRSRTRHTHGTGCTYSAAITAGLARGLDLIEAVGVAKRYISAAIATAPGLGGGSGPVNQHAEPS